jgi:WD40 repeat protein
MSDILQLLWQGQLNDSITAITTSADCWAASSAAGEVVCWKNATLTHYQTAQKFSIDCLAYSAAGHYLAASGQAGIVQIWRDDEPWQTISHSRTWIDRLHWHPHLPLLAVAVGKLVQVWDIENQKLLVTLPFDRSSVFDLAWHPAGSHLAVAGYGGVAVWQWEQWQQYELLAVETSAHRLAWSGDGSFLAAATIDRQLTIAKLAELELPWIIPDLPAKIRQLQWFAGTQTVAIISDGELICWQYADESWYPNSSSGRTLGIATHPQLPILASITPAGWITLQDTDFTVLAQIDQQTTDLPDSFATCARGDRAILQWNRIGDHLVIGNKNGQLSWWSIQL